MAILALVSVAAVCSLYCAYCHYSKASKQPKMTIDEGYYGRVQPTTKPPVVTRAPVGGNMWASAPQLSR